MLFPVSPVPVISPFFALTFEHNQMTDPVLGGLAGISFRKFVQRSARLLSQFHLTVLGAADLVPPHGNSTLC